MTIPDHAINVENFDDVKRTLRLIADSLADNEAEVAYLRSVVAGGGGGTGVEAEDDIAPPLRRPRPIDPNWRRRPRPIRPGAEGIEQRPEGRNRREI